MAAVWVSVKLGDHMTREHLSEVLGLSPVLRELADFATEFLNVVIGTFDENHVLPEGIIMEGVGGWWLCTSQ